MVETKTDTPEGGLGIKLGAAKPTAASAAAQSPKKGPDKGGFYWGTGRRKSAVARVRIKPGSGKILINKREMTDYFKRQQDQNTVVAALKAIDAEKSFDIFVNVQGGGTTGQAGASLLGIARALKKYDDSLVHTLRDGGHLTRDPRMVERKKPGQRGARRKFQFSKR
ncbi:MAG: 30S ribosomal protein S9 [Sedimentisphaerales bacterium]|nr:30S ribosomal protein S9 [Sedimentisphaerales bacterium]